MTTPSVVTEIARTRLPTAHGQFTAIAYRDHATGLEHVALMRGEGVDLESVLVRVHSECLTGDVFGSLRCDCGAQLDAALAQIEAEGRGAVVYLRGHEGRGIGLGPKLAAYALQDLGHDTVEANEALGFAADGRSYGAAAAILTALGITRVRLLTNNPAKCVELVDHGIEVAERVPLVVGTHPENVRYLSTKRDKLGHLLEGIEAGASHAVAHE